MHLFVYGSLMCPEVQTLILGRSFPVLGAVLNGFARWSLKERSYPALVRNQNSRVEGLLLMDLQESELIQLDLFEGDEFDRIPVEVSPRDVWYRKLSGYVYIYKDKLAFNLLEKAWSLDLFRDKHLEQFLQNYS